MSFWPFRPAEKRQEPPVRDPNIPCKYCTKPHRWRMEIWGHVIYVCGHHTDTALDEYAEMRNSGKVSAD